MFCLQRLFFDIHAVIEILNDVCYNKLKGGEAWSCLGQVNWGRLFLLHYF